MFCSGMSVKAPLRPCYTVKQVSRYLYHATCCIMILVSLHTKSSSMFHAEIDYKLFRPKWRILTMKTLLIVTDCRELFKNNTKFNQI